MIFRIFACFCLLLSLNVAAQVREQETAATREQKARDLIEKFNLDYQQKDSEAIAALVSPDLTVIAMGKVFNSWQEYRDSFLAPAFLRRMPPSTWDIEKASTTPELAWAYTKTNYKGRRQGQETDVNLYQFFILQKEKPADQKSHSSSSSSSSADWKIVAMEYMLHTEQPENAPKADSPNAQAQPH